MTPVMSERKMAMVGAFLVALGPMSMALYTPALPTLVDVYGTNPGLVQLTLSLYFAGFAGGQLLCGPLSDAYGRRSVALGFLAIYLAGSAIAAFAPSVDWLLAARLIQGIGASAGIAIARAMVRDQFTGQTSARILNLIGIMLGFAPAFAPTVGGILLSLTGWHSIFLLMLVYGALAMVLVGWIPETLKTPAPALARPGRLVRSYGQLLVSPAFMRATLVIGASLGGIYTLAAILPFVMIDVVGLQPATFGLVMILQSGTYIAGSLLTQFLLRTHDATRLVPYGLALIAGSACLMLVVLRVTEPGILTVMGPVAIWAFGIGLLLPGATMAALANFPLIAGAASALMGFFQIGGGLAGSLVAALFDSPIEAMTVVQPAMAAIAVAAHLGLARAERREARLDPADYEFMAASDPAGYIGPPGKRLSGAARTVEEELEAAAE